MSPTPQRPRRSPRLKANCYNEDAQWNSLKQGTEADDTSLFSREDDTNTAGKDTTATTTNSTTATNITTNSTAPAPNEITFPGDTAETRQHPHPNPQRIGRYEIIPALGFTDRDGNTIVEEPATLVYIDQQREIIPLQRIETHDTATHPRAFLPTHILPPLIPIHNEQNRHRQENNNAEGSLQHNHAQSTNAEYESVAEEEDNESVYPNLQHNHAQSNNAEYESASEEEDNESVYPNLQHNHAQSTNNAEYESVAEEEDNESAAEEEDNESVYMSAKEEPSNTIVLSTVSSIKEEEQIVNIKQEDVDEIQNYGHCDGIHPALRSRQIRIKQEENVEFQHDWNQYEYTHIAHEESLEGSVNEFGEHTTENDNDDDEMETSEQHSFVKESSEGSVNEHGEHTTENDNDDEMETSEQHSSEYNPMVATLSKRKCKSVELKSFLKEKGKKCCKPKKVYFDVSVILKGVDQIESTIDKSSPLSSQPNKGGRKRKFQKNETGAEVESKPSKKRGRKSKSYNTSEENMLNEDGKFAGHFYSSGLQSDGLELLDKVGPPNSKTFPKTEFCQWSFEENTRVLLGSFDSKRIKEAKSKQDNFRLDEDMSFLLKMMERTDFAVVTEGLFIEPRDEYLWDPTFIKARTGDNVFHRFRVFEKNQFNQNEIDELRKNGSSLEDFKKRNDEGVLSKPFELFTEVNGDISMRIRDFLEICKVQENLHDPNIDHIVKYKNLKGGDEEFDAKNKTLYMIDFDLKGMLPETYDDFMQKFLIPELLPGGNACMMHSVNSNGRPFMGPNYYQTFPGSFTHFHQDGYGTVDSGHLCIEGYNEVIMLRRMDDDHKRHALSILQCDDGRKGDPEAFDALYGLPHHNNTKPLWPTKSAIAECDKYNYSPCVFILKPGQMLHINKGRLHAFRKMSCEALEQNDCHQEVRKSVVEENNITSNLKCTSVAWDWMYLGTTLEGIKAEVSQTVNSAKLARDNLKQSLAIPQVSIVERAKYELAQCKIASMRGDKATVENSIKILTALQGSLSKLFGDQIELFKIASTGDGIYKDPLRKLIVKPTADSHEKITSIDPFGNDFFCSLCFQELGNIYMHCEGCEELLQKDYNLCVGCYSDEGRFLTGFQMNAFLSMEKKQGQRTDYNHYPNKKQLNKSCRCKNGPNCRRCRLQTCCSCRCHAEYSLHYRFYDQNAMENILKDVEQTLNHYATRLCKPNL